jgi:hypothetical protein
MPDAYEQRNAAAELAKSFDDPVEFNEQAVPQFDKLGAGEIVQIFREAHGLDVRTGDELRPDLQPGSVINTIDSGERRVKGEFVSDADTTAPQEGVMK